MFGFSFGEILVLLIVGIVVVGPRKLPMMMRTAGQWIAKLRRMSTDLRAQSGIDDLIRQEGLERELRELRSLSRVNVIETLVTPVATAAGATSVVAATPRLPPKISPPTAPTAPQQAEADDGEPPEPPLREREYPLLGCDSYGAFADDTGVYSGEVRLSIDETGNETGNETGDETGAPEPGPEEAASPAGEAGAATAGEAGSAGAVAADVGREGAR